MATSVLITLEDKYCTCMRERERERNNLIKTLQQPWLLDWKEMLDLGISA